MADELTREDWQAACEAGEQVAHTIFLRAVNALPDDSNPKAAYGMALGCITELGRIMRAMTADEPKSRQRLEFSVLGCVRGAVRGLPAPVDADGTPITDLN